MKIISVVTIKAGSGKTATVLNLSSALGQKGLRILVIDATYDNDITSIMVPQHLANNCKTLFDALNGTSIEECICESISKNVDIIPSDENLETINCNIIKNICVEAKLRMIVTSATIQEYDYILIDNGSGRDSLMKRTLVISDTLLIPINGSIKFARLQKIAKYIADIKVDLNKNLDCGYVFFTFQEYRTEYSKSLSDFKQIFGDRVLLTEVPYTTIIKSSMDKKQPLLYYNPKCKGTVAYKKLADEIIEKFTKGKNINERTKYEEILKQYATASDRYSKYLQQRNLKK